MTLTVRLFAKLRDAAAADAVAVELPSAATVADVRRAVAARLPAVADLVYRSAVAVDRAVADDTMAVPAAAEVAVLPPVSGG